MNWHDALDAQVDAWRWYRDTEGGQRELQGFAESLLTSYIDPDQNGLGPEELKAAVEKLYANPESFGQSIVKMTGYLPQVLLNADPIYVDGDMMTLCEAAVKTWQPEPLAETDLLIPAGFMLLPRPLRSNDIHGREVATRAFAWTYTPLLREEGTTEDKPGILLYMFSDLRDKDYYSERDLELTKRAFPGRSTPLALMHAIPWRFGDKPETPPGSFTGIELLQCMLRLMGQTIAVQSKRNPPRHASKRAIRAKFPEKRITVVTLRRPEGPAHEVEHGKVEWSRRWIVEGHWRNQWYPSMNLHRQIWISPYVKGPEDMPLVIPKAHVYQFVR